jgi:hypothetical protein
MPTAHPKPPTTPEQIADLVAFWRFDEPAGQPRASCGGPRNLLLEERQGPIARADDGVFGPHAAHLIRGQWFSIERDQIGGLDIHGKDAQVTVVAWIKRLDTSPWQTIAGVWGETQKTRQYCLFLNAPRGTRCDTMVRYPLANRVHGHVSAVGGPTPGHKYCITYASGATEIPMEQWSCIAMSYDGSHARVFVDGRLDRWELRNPFPYPDGLYDAGPGGAPFTVGSVHRHDEWGNFFGGLIGGLAVYGRALSEDELKAIARPSAGRA